MRCDSRVPSHSWLTPGVSTGPFPVCGSARCVRRKCQEIIITGATVSKLHGDVGRDRRRVTEKSDGMTGCVIEEGYQSKCEEYRRHGMHPTS